MTKNWIREHFHTFVIPALELVRNFKSQPPPMKEGWMWRSEGPSTPRSDQVVYCPSPVKAAGEGWFHELRLLRNYCEYAGIDSSTIANSHGGATPPVKDGWRRIRNSFQSVASQAKKLNMPLLLPGRDVWVWEVLARRHNIPSLFIPQISRPAISDPVALRNLLDECKVSGKELMVDTGFYGTIPKAIGEALGQKVTFMLLSQNHVYDGEPEWTWGKRLTHGSAPNQIFPGMSGSRSLALWVEYLPKYFQCGKVVDGKVTQHLAGLNEIAEAAILTSCVWRGIDWQTARDYVFGKPGTIRMKSMYSASSGDTFSVSLNSEVIASADTFTFKPNGHLPLKQTS